MMRPAQFEPIEQPHPEQEPEYIITGRQIIALRLVLDKSVVDHLCSRPYTVPIRVGTMIEKELIEKLAALEHEQWTYWASAIEKSENISPERCARWKTSMVPYSELPDEVQEFDRIWARKVIEILNSYQLFHQDTPLMDITVGTSGANR